MSNLIGQNVTTMVEQRIDAGCLLNAAPISIKGQLPDPIVNSLRLYWVSAKSMTYLRHISPTSLQYRIPFDMGTGQPQSFYVATGSTHTMPSYLASFPGLLIRRGQGLLLSYLKFCLGRTRDECMVQNFSIRFLSGLKSSCY